MALWGNVLALHSVHRQRHSSAEICHGTAINRDAQRRHSDAHRLIAKAWLGMALRWLCKSGQGEGIVTHRDTLQWHSIDEKCIGKAISSKVMRQRCVDGQSSGTEWDSNAEALHGKTRLRKAN